ncbi:MAG TPA: HD domain-containing phosphohydrolase [Dissulfurispiraceae bacterium]|nr:HD domain-containing phosphohydrolase [Dissulfurispiraceae bacterium]
MKLDFVFMSSKVARRIFLIFICCALLPIGSLAFLSLHQLSEDHKEKTFQKLHQASKNIGMSIIEGLAFIQAEMDIVAHSGNAGSSRYILHKLHTSDESTSHRLLGLTLFENRKAVRTFLGTPCPFPEVADADLQHLSAGKGALYIQAPNKGAYRLFLIVGDDVLSDNRRLLIGEVNPDYLWVIAKESLPPMTDAYIYTASGMPLFNTGALSPHGVQEIENRMKSASAGRLQWNDGSGTYFAGQWSVFLKSFIYAEDWKVIVTESGGNAFAALGRIRVIIAIVLLGSFMVVLFLVSVQIRKNLEPLARLKDGTQRVSQGDFESRISVRSGDEFEDLASSFNTMSERIGRHFDSLSEMGRMSTSILTSLDREAIVRTVLLRLSGIVSCDSVSLTVFEQQETLKASTYVRTGEHESSPGIIKMETSLQFQESRRLANCGSYMIVESDDEFKGLLSIMKERGCNRYVLLPIIHVGRLSAVLALGYIGQPQRLEEDCIKARQIADHTASALANTDLLGELDQLSWGTLTALARTVDANSGWTAGHSERVTSLSLQIGREMGLTAEELDILHRAGLLHDIGKIGIPSHILDKPARLTEDEYALIKEHPEKGVRILEPIKAYHEVFPIVGQHHEWFNGQGYPNGLAAERICMGARIIAVADVFDALISDRPYRKGKDKDIVMAHINEKAGLQFDPEVVKAFIRISSTPYFTPDSSAGMPAKDYISAREIKG